MGDSLAIVCGDALIDSITYDHGGRFPEGVGPFVEAKISWLARIMSR